MVLYSSFDFVLVEKTAENRRSKQSIKLDFWDALEFSHKKCKVGQK
jgi:hypothetical protein